MASVKKICEIKGGGQEMAMMVKVDDKNVITAIQVNLCPASLGISTKNSPELLLLNFLPSTYSITAKCLCAWLQLARPAAKNNDSRSGELYFWWFDMVRSYTYFWGPIEEFVKILSPLIEEFFFLIVVSDYYKVLQ